MLVRSGVGGVVPGLGHGLLEDRLLEGARPGKPQPVIGHHPDADARRCGRRQGLHLSIEGTDLGLVASGHIHLDLLAGTGPAGHPLGHCHQLARLIRAAEWRPGSVFDWSSTMVLTRPSLRW